MSLDNGVAPVLVTFSISYLLREAFGEGTERFGSRIARLSPAGNKGAVEMALWEERDSRHSQSPRSLPPHQGELPLLPGQFDGGQAHPR